jgi:hypothetical protein
MPISKTAVTSKGALARLEKIPQTKFSAQEVAEILGLDKHVVLYHIRKGTLAPKTVGTKAKKEGYVVTRSSLRKFIGARP